MIIRMVIFLSRSLTALSLLLMGVLIAFMEKLTENSITTKTQDVMISKYYLRWNKRTHKFIAIQRQIMTL